MRRGRGGKEGMRKGREEEWCRGERRKSGVEERREKKRRGLKGVGEVMRRG